MSKKLVEKFTEKAKIVLSSASRQAKHLGSNFVDTEHILLAILESESCVGYKIITSFQTSPEKMRESIINSTESETIQEKSGFSESAQEAIAQATLQAYLLGNAYVGTEHLLYGLAKTPLGLAYHVLQSWGISYDMIKSKLENYSPATVQSHTETATPLLNTYGKDLTLLALSKELDPIIGREEEINRVIQILARRTKNNPVLIGEAGVGKTAIVEGLAQKIVQHKVPQKFFNTRIVSLDINSLVAGTRFRGDFEERLLGLLEEIKEAANITLFIDEIQTIIGAGSAGGALDAANILKPVLSKGEVSCIGSTTADEYTEFIEENPALERRFQPIYVEEPDIKNTISILEGLKRRYENHHGVHINKKAISAAAKLASRYIVDRHLPDSAIDLMDETASRKALSANQLNSKALQIGSKIENIRLRKEALLRQEEWDLALKLKEKEQDFSKKLDKSLVKQKTEDSSMVEEEDIAFTVSSMTGIPIEDITSSEAAKLLNLEKQLAKKVVGQGHVLKQISSLLRRSRVGLHDPNKPIGSFIFLGTSGVGKTLVAQTLAETLFGDPESLVRFDMSEFSEPHTVARFMGAPPGYVGYEEGGELVEKLRHHPYSVVLLDEIEKAHSEVFNVLLQILDNGRLTDGKGREINFRNTIIIMTSNVGSHLIKKEGEIGFGRSKEKTESFKYISEKLTEELKKRFRVEFLNRIDSTIVFKPLSKETVKKIARLLVKETATRLKQEHKIELEVAEGVFDFLVEKGFSQEFGAREMRRVITEYLADPLSEGILSSRFKKDQKVKACVTKGDIVIKTI